MIKLGYLFLGTLISRDFAFVDAERQASFAVDNK